MSAVTSPVQRPSVSPLKALSKRPFRVAEFFAGVGLVRKALESDGTSFKVVFSNDIEHKKERLYRRNFGDGPEFRLGDICELHGEDLPQIDLATASFPCTDLSLAGNRKGLKGEQSGAFHEFARVLDEMGERRPSTALIENVIGFATSHGGADLRAVIQRLNGLGYVCDLFTVDASFFVPQSRPRVFIVGARGSLPKSVLCDWSESKIRPKWIRLFVEHNRDLKLQAYSLPEPPTSTTKLADIVEDLPARHKAWWNPVRSKRFTSTLPPLHRQRLAAMMRSKTHSWATAYRRTRNGKPVWEIRSDQISGCLRTTRGGSSRQALVKAYRGGFRVRWMTAREYARLQGFDDFVFDESRENEALFALGDAVCVPVLSWIAREYLVKVCEA